MMTYNDEEFENKLEEMKLAIIDLPDPVDWYLDYGHIVANAKNSNATEAYCAFLATIGVHIELTLFENFMNQKRLFAKTYNLYTTEINDSDFKTYLKKVKKFLTPTLLEGTISDITKAFGTINGHASNADELFAKLYGVSARVHFALGNYDYADNHIKSADASCPEFKEENTYIRLKIEEKVDRGPNRCSFFAPTNAGHGISENEELAKKISELLCDIVEKLKSKLWELRENTNSEEAQPHLHNEITELNLCVKELEESNNNLTHKTKQLTFADWLKDAKDILSKHVHVFHLYFDEEDLRKLSWILFLEPKNQLKPSQSIEQQDCEINAILELIFDNLIEQAIFSLSFENAVQTRLLNGFSDFKCGLANMLTDLKNEDTLTKYYNDHIGIKQETPEEYDERLYNEICNARKAWRDGKYIHALVNSMNKRCDEIMGNFNYSIIACAEKLFVSLNRYQRELKMACDMTLKGKLLFSLSQLTNKNKQANKIR